ncbi:hypothetical protein Tco_1369965 [Tanacetum coccineum]
MKLVDDDQARMVRHTFQNPYYKSLPLSNFKSLPLSNFKNSIKDFKGTVLYELAELEFQEVAERLRYGTRANPYERSTFEVVTDNQEKDKIKAKTTRNEHGNGKSMKRQSQSQKNDKKFDGQDHRTWALLKMKGHDDKLTSLTQQTHPQSISVKKHNGKKTKMEEVKDT